jgi:hypothetical protein
MSATATPGPYTRDGLDRAAAKVRETAAKAGQTLTHSEARQRVEAAVKRTPHTGDGR